MSDDPLLTTLEAANVLGCDERGVRFLVKHNKLPLEPEARGERRFWKFRRRAVEAIKPYYRRLRDFQEGGCHLHPERGKEYTLQKAAQECHISLYLLRQAVKDRRLPAEEIYPAPTGAHPWIIVLAKDVLALQVRTRQAVQESARLNRKRWKPISEIAIAIGARAPAVRAEVSECAKCWAGIGRLPSQKATVCQRGKVPESWRETEGGSRDFANLREVQRSRVLTFYDYPVFQKLWEADYVPAGVRRLKELVSEHNGRCPARVVQAELETLGIASKSRRARIAKAARIKGVHDWGAKAKNQIVYAFDGATRPTDADADAILRSILENGPVAAGDGLRAARARGLTTPEAYEGLKRLNVPLQPKGTVGPHLWILPAQQNATTGHFARLKPTHPRWDDLKATLFWGDIPIREFRRHPAPNQRELVEAFHRANWQNLILSPFGTDGEKLNASIYHLNRSLDPKVIHFRSDGTGEGAIWEPAE
jgi:hypothetical protein